MSTKKPTKRSPARPTKASKTTGLIKTRFKFSKLGVTTLAAALAVVGTIYVFSSHASSACSSGGGGVFQCPENTAGHSGGSAINEHIYWQSTSGATSYGTRTLWKATYNQTSSPSGRYMWYGPNASVAMHTGESLQACWYYMLSSSGLPVEFNFAVTSPVNQSLQANGTGQLAASHTITRSGIKYYQLQHYCTPLLKPTSPPVTWGGVQIRLKLNPSSNNNAPLYMYKTTYVVGVAGTVAATSQAVTADSNF